MGSSQSPSTMHSIDEVNEYLYISGYGTITEQKLRKLGITLVVDATNVFSKAWTDVELLKVPVDDSDFAKLDQYFDTVADKIDQHARRNGKVLYI